MSRITIMINPCRNCNKRHIGCHSKCKEYIDWKAEWDKRKELERKYKEKENLAWRYRK